MNERISTVVGSDYSLVFFSYAAIDTLFAVIQDRPSTKVHAAPGGGSSLGYLFGGN